ncbi:MAG: glycosyltransferase family 2 protein [Chitinophagaceae bacterium]|nr:glycosyltransferase family 2 protein [Chitinophagaceae bacterium]
MDLSIIIINYKTPVLLQQCLQSLYAFTIDVDFEVIVVDNHSQDNTGEMLEKYFPVVRFIKMTYNAGFARGNNEGIRQAKGKMVLLLNSDTIVEDNAIGICCNNFSISGYVACGVQLLNPDRTSQISGNYFMKGGLNYLLPLPYVGAMLKCIAGIFKVKKPNVQHAKGIVEVDWINGAFLMVKRDAIEKAGLLDEDFFLYAEEAEWCSRLRKIGKLCIYGDLNIIHLQGETANETFGSSGKGYFNLFDRKGLQIMLSNFLRIRKQFGVRWFLIDLFFYLFTIPVFFVGMLSSKLIYQNRSKYTFKQWAAFSKNVFRLIGFSKRL